LAATMAVALAGCGQETSADYATSPPVVESPPPPPGPVVEQATGVIARQGGRPQAGFQLITSPGAGYYVKLVDLASGAAVLTAFVRGGEAFETEVPLGDFELRYASGEVWYGEQHLFGAQTSYAKADDTLRFYIEGNVINGNAIELIPSIGGTLERVPIDPSAF